MSTRGRLAVLAGCVLVALAVAWYAGSRFAPSPAAPAAGTVRLGPEAGEDVAAYLARLPATLPPDSARAPALVQLAAEATVPDALAAVAGTTPLTAVFRVPLPRVQTALRFVALEPDVPVATALDNARVRAEREAAADASHLTDRPRAVAAAEAAALGRPGLPLCRRAGGRRRQHRARRGRPAHPGAGGGGRAAGNDRGGAGALATAAGADRPRGSTAGRRPGAAGILIGG